MALAPITGAAFVFGDNVSTDAMAPGHAFTLPWEKRRHALFPERPGFCDQISEGDIIVAGANWGCGSSREQAVENIKLLGAAMVIAESFARIHFRNAIANALPAIICPELRNRVREGDLLRFDWSNFQLVNLTTNVTMPCTPYTDEMMSIIEHGGMMALLKQKLSETS